MAKLKKNPSKAGISAASVTGNAGPHNHGVEKGRQGNNQQYKSIIWAKNNAIFLGRERGIMINGCFSAQFICNK